MISTALSAELTWGAAAAGIELPTMAPIIGVLKRLEEPYLVQFAQKLTESLEAGKRLLVKAQLW
jgi:hypothetical protein